MSHGQRQRFKMRASYVQALERAGIGLSPKSHDFAHVVGANHSSRLASWTTRLAKSPGQLDDWVEPSAPAPSSVYRWYLQYRKAGNDLRVLAQEALATHTRTARKPKEREVLEAFLANRLAAIGTQSVSDLTNDFNRLMARTDPLHIDDLIENLYLEAQVKADQNRAARRGKSSMKKKFKATTASHGFENSFGRQGESIATAHET